MDKLKESFEDVADWCEKHLEEKRGPEIGMTFGAMLRAYGRLARFPYRLEGEQRAEAQRDLNAKAEELLVELSNRFLVAYKQLQGETDSVPPNSNRAKKTYDPGKRPKE
jgi:hypothetical protein